VQRRLKLLGDLFWVSGMGRGSLTTPRAPSTCPAADAGIPPPCPPLGLRVEGQGLAIGIGNKCVNDG